MTSRNAWILRVWWIEPRGRIFRGRRLGHEKVSRSKTAAYQRLRDTLWIIGGARAADAKNWRFTRNKPGDIEASFWAVDRRWHYTLRRQRLKKADLR